MPLAARASIRENHARLKAAQKSSRGAPLYSVLINRPLGRAFAAVAHRWGLEPNHVTALSALFTFTGIGLIAVRPPTLLAGLIITVALVVGYALDAADGQLARLRGGGSLDGEWLDHVIDSVKVATLHLAVLITMFRHFNVSDVWLLVPVVFAAVGVIHFFGMILTELLTRNAHLRLGDAPPAGHPSRVMSALKLPTDYGVLCLVFLLFGLPVVFQWTYFALTLASTAYTILVLPVWFRRLRALDATISR